MTDAFNKIELLAPAGGADSFYAAVNNGADAVYLGLSSFNARMKADNFNLTNVRSFIEYAHLYGVKVYITINTLLHNKEFIELIELVKAAVSAKADAFIIQDVGVAHVLRECFPSIVLHASTQMGIHNLWGALEAERAGFKRVVLARETRLEDIREIKRNTSLELEFFVQGALCVCLSGNCYLSEKEFGLSGNRGLCKQPCRMKYTAQTKEGEREGYFLSAKDLSLIEELETLAEAGVTSFKIEGRLRRAGYVGAATAAYRRILNSFSDGTEKDRRKKLIEDEKKNLAAAFSRGFSDKAYLYGVSDIINPINQSHIGVSVGEVLSVKPFKDLNEITIRSRHPLIKGDGLKFFDNGEEKASLGVGNAEEISKGIYKLYSTAKARAGYKVSLTLDRQAEAEYLKKTRELKIDVTARLFAGEYPMLCAQCGGVSVNVKGDIIIERALTAPADESYIFEQLSKLGGSGFKLTSLKTDTDGVFIAKSTLNALRRELVRELREAIIFDNEKNITARFDAEKYEKTFGKNNINEVKVQGRLIFVDKAEGSEIIKCGDIAVISPENYTEKEISLLIARTFGYSALALELPAIASGDEIELIKKLLLRFKEIKYVVSQNLYGLAFLKTGHKVIAGALMNVENDFAARALTQAGAAGVQRGNYSLNCVVFDSAGYVKPLMTLAHCQYRTLYKNECDECTFAGKLKFKRSDREYMIERVRIIHCYFRLKPIKEI